MHYSSSSERRVRVDGGGDVASPAQRDVRLGGLRRARVRRRRGSAESSPHATHRPQRRQHEHLDRQRAVLAKPALAGIGQVRQLQQLREAPVVLSAAAGVGKSAVAHRSRASPEQLLHAPVKLVLRHFHQRRRCAVGHDERKARELDPERRQAALEVAGDRQIQRQERHRVAAREQQQAPREAAGVEGGSVRAVGGILLKGGPVVDAPPEAAGRTRQAQPGVSAA